MTKTKTKTITGKISNKISPLKAKGSLFTKKVTQISIQNVQFNLK